MAVTFTLGPRFGTAGLMEEGELEPFKHLLRSHVTWRIFRLAATTYTRINGAQWAGAFAHYAFFSFFPLIILLVAVASAFIERNLATARIIGFIERYVPIGDERQRYVFDTVAGVIDARGPAGLIALATLSWAAMRSFAVLIRIVNRAWQIDAAAWWRLPLKSLGFLASVVAAVPLGVAAPPLLQRVREWFLPGLAFAPWMQSAASLFLSSLAVFLGLSLFYKFAPRRYISYAHVWRAALFGTALLQAAGGLFAIYLRDFASLNAVYGTFGSIMALLLWIYVSGCIFIFGACLCAAYAVERADIDRDSSDA